MESAEVVERIEHIAAVRSDDRADAAALEAGVVSLQKVRAWIDEHEGALVARLVGHVSFPEATIAAASKASLGSAAKVRERSETLASVPRLAAALNDGRLTAGFIDAVTRGCRQIDTDGRRELLRKRLDALVDVASAGTIERWTRRIRAEVRRLQIDDGEGRLERQCRSVRLGMWTDGDGMWNLRGRFDPARGVGLAARIDRTVETLFAESVPQGCPTDPIERQRFLAAHALARLIEADGGAGGTRRPEVVVVVDADAPDVPGPVAEWAIPVELPARVLAELAGESDVTGVVVRNGVVLHAPGNLNLGRTTRLANRAQRRALRGLYRGCAIPGCGVAYDRCRLHHVIWWRNGGRTDLENLLPVCTKHHGNVHNDGWVVELGPRRQLTLRLPDGTIHNTGPPTRRAA